ncbi:MAG: DsbA family oxidoreductase [Burkholderiales bacterium]|nr:MAG: DsbA family oxidoreductase [Burkholderiales bacterium]TAG81424.1 MAG: DsbA family oxidoreductase [Betaproteobacteria bacterium]
MTTAPPSLHIDIVSDVVCPWCYIGKRHLEAALRMWRGKSGVNTQIAVSTRWHPFQLNPDLPSAGVDRKSYLEEKFGGPTRAKEIYARVGAAGAAAGLELNFDAIERQPNTLAAHALIALAQEGADAANDSTQIAARADQIVESLFKAYFVEGRFIGDLEILLDIAETNGLNRDDSRKALSDAFALDRVASADASARGQGVSGVPFFVFNRKYALSGAQPASVLVSTIERSLLG